MRIRTLLHLPSPTTTCVADAHGLLLHRLPDPEIAQFPIPGDPAVIVPAGPESRLSRQVISLPRGATWTAVPRGFVRQSIGFELVTTAFSANPRICGSTRWRNCSAVRDCIQSVAIS